MSLIDKIAEFVFPESLLRWIMSDAPEPPREAPPAPPAYKTAAEIAMERARSQPSTLLTPMQAPPDGYWAKHSAFLEQQRREQLERAAAAEAAHQGKIIPIPTRSDEFGDIGDLDDIKTDEFEDEELLALFEEYIETEAREPVITDDALHDLLAEIIQGFCDWLPNKHVAYHGSYKNVICSWLKSQDFLRGRFLVGHGEIAAEPPPAAEKPSWERWIRGAG